MNATAGTLQDRYADVRGRILDAAQRSGRSGDQILLVAVTKYAEPEQIKQLLTLGQRDFAENHVQQLVQRAALLDEHLQRLSVLPETLRRGARESDMLPDEPDRHAPIRWHMIGHLQRNKARKIFDCTRLVHSVSSPAQSTWMRTSMTRSRLSPTCWSSSAMRSESTECTSRVPSKILRALLRWRCPIMCQRIGAWR
ncbi:MAG: hypothetical protein ACF8SC_00635, partial [Phycisphaerales bacterium JB037]